ncbi:Pentatricopeptide repeat-containing protein, chloroplastic [Galdieria sulphuraria]|nr:Pentatricopeptide repeat-containing protein, chloroplastic [Galdieria sulphuraria]
MGWMDKRRRLKVMDPIFGFIPTCSRCPFASFYRISFTRKNRDSFPQPRYLSRLWVLNTRLGSIRQSRMMSTFEMQSEQRFGIHCGDLVQVKTDLVVYHVPKMKGQGEPITANYPVVVEFQHDSLVFTSHLAVEELQRVDKAD